MVTGTFYVYDDEVLAKKHVNPTIFSRLEKTKTKLAEAESATEEQTKDAEVKADEPTKEESKEETPTKDAEVKADEPTKEVEKSE